MHGVLYRVIVQYVSILLTVFPNGGYSTAAVCTPYSVLHTPYFRRTGPPEIPARHVHRPKRQVLGA
jgi:hypothetical protein